MFIDQDKMDKTLYKIQREQNEGLQSLESDGAAKSTIWPDTVSDLWSGMFKSEPKMTEGAVGPLANALQEVMETQEWKNLREVTKLDEFNSAVGTVSFGREFLDRLPDEVLKAEEAAQREQHLKEVIEDYENKGVPESVRERLRQLAEEASQQSAIKMAKAMQACDGDINQAIRIAGRAASTQASEDAIEAKEFSQAWGNGAGTGKKLSLAGQLALANKIKNDKTMAMFAKIIGRMKRLAQGYQAKKIEKKPEEIVDVETGNDLTSVLPSEFARLNHPLAKLDFRRRYLERNLLQFKKTGSDKAGKGPIMLMVDESGSMHGERIAWAKAVGMGLCWIAQKQKRSMIIGGFSSSGQIWTKEFPQGKITSAEMEWFAQQFYGGGTDFEMALEGCVKSIRATKMQHFKKADVVFISDGDCYIGSKFREKFKATKKELGMRVMAIGVGCSADSFRDFSDAAFGFNGRLDGDESALERVFSI